MVTTIIILSIISAAFMWLAFDKYGNRRMFFLFAWYDLWIGFYWDKKKKWFYFFPIPCFGFVIKFRYP